ncbi:Xaa-Pro peptidase family protein [Sedimentitalea sp. JM2-8]|uniref:Xaa-Pro peptidase family protein n=1 Tax=Sedimentitalea xiamensis TaxID=3050037 RepID=A0ABT7FBX0_9RHOB|nr:Xaa-Pro peptidase family protein [Sedimentitalea xiamensis]MDK3072611.1 Xaa-Pro peptidase family protein [Sedimentitalea xiamensis]
MIEPERGFPEVEYRSRVENAQSLMAREGLDALLLNTEPDVRYFSGFLTRFWESPTRPWFLVLPQSGLPIAVIPKIGAALMAKTWIADIRSWQAPDPVDDGVTLLAETLSETLGGAGRVGVPMGQGTCLRMPLRDWHALKARLPRIRFDDDSDIVKRLRMVKSEREIAKIRNACAIADRAFARVPDFACSGTPLDRVFRRFQAVCLEEGADWVPYLAGGAGQGGYDDVISPATSAPLKAGDVLMLDTGLVHDGYFCDFDRNFSVGRPDDGTRAAHERLVDAVAAASEIARPGTIAADLFHAMDRVLSGGAGGADAGRLGHGLGMQLTEGLSLIPEDDTVLETGMVLTLEPGLDRPGGRIMVHEENIAIRDGAPAFLSRRASRDITVLDG